MKNGRSLFIVESGMVAALYVALTWISALTGLSYGGIQFRLSEVLTILPVFMPAAIPGLTIGCLIANISSPFGFFDMAFGTLATLLAALLSYLCRKIRLKGLPVLSAAWPVLLNAIAVASIIGIFTPSTSFFSIFAISFLQVGLGELITGFVGGLLLYKMLCKYNLEEVIKKQNS